MSGETTTNCGYCGERVDPADEDVVYARELVLGETFFGGRTFTEGAADYFHRHCYRHVSSFELLPKPDP